MLHAYENIYVPVCEKVDIRVTPPSGSFGWTSPETNDYMSLRSFLAEPYATDADTTYALMGYFDDDVGFGPRTLDARSLTQEYISDIPEHFRKNIHTLIVADNKSIDDVNMFPSLTSLDASHGSAVGDDGIRELRRLEILYADYNRNLVDLRSQRS